MSLNNIWHHIEVTDYVDPIILLDGDVMDMGVNLSWSLESQGVDNAGLRFSLRVSDGSSIQEITLFNESTYYFTAPEGASPCEVYNFSVTATYVGATYTGTGCNVPSTVLSTMLPSLPSISQLEASLNYVLIKKSTGFSLHISFEVCAHSIALSPGPFPAF